MADTTQAEHYETYQLLLVQYRDVCQNLLDMGGLPVVQACAELTQIGDRLMDYETRFGYTDRSDPSPTLPKVTWPHIGRKI